MSDYTNPFVPGEQNQDFWNEVLVGRSIASLEFNTGGVSAIILDNGERVVLAGSGSFYIQDTEGGDQVRKDAAIVPTP